MLDEPSPPTRAAAKAAPAFPEFDNSYARLPRGFHAGVSPTPVANPRLVAVNRVLAADLGLNLDALTEPEWAGIFAGNVLPPGAAPIAMAYAGHQFGQYSPRLGDGRAVLLGEVVDRAGVRRDIQLKGAGRTPFSRQGDGRAALGPVLREYIVSEAFHALGLPTTRSLAAVTTGEKVYREVVLPGAVLTRVASSHIRVGTFQFLAAQSDIEAVRLFVDYVTNRHYPEIRSAERPALALLDAVVERQSALIAGWMHVGFIHGVMNTDNMTVSGETIDFGPCAFMDAFDPAKVFSSIDRMGRYAYANQPRIGQWNCARLAETLLPLIDENSSTALELAQASIGAFSVRFEAHWLAGMRRKLGLLTDEDADLTLASDFLEVMHAQSADFTLSFRGLCDAVDSPSHETALRSLFTNPSALDEWLARRRARLARQPQTPRECAAVMRRANPAFIPRNHRIEQAIVAAVEHGDLSLFETLMDVLAHPFEDQPRYAAYAEPPRADECVLQTFCGT
jgi:uncharacterized protein YdiU (UPF0061 family)